RTARAGRAAFERGLGPTAGGLSAVLEGNRRPGRGSRRAGSGMAGAPGHFLRSSGGRGRPLANGASVATGIDAFGCGVVSGAPGGAGPVGGRSLQPSQWSLDAPSAGDAGLDSGQPRDVWGG